MNFPPLGRSSTLKHGLKLECGVEFGQPFFAGVVVRFEAYILGEIAHTVGMVCSLVSRTVIAL